MSILAGLTGVVFGAIFASAFVITCIISTIKAVRDRSRIKRQIILRKANRLEIENIDIEHGCGIEDDPPSSSYTNQSLRLEKPKKGTSNHGLTDHFGSSVYSVETGIDNMIFKQSNTNIDDENHFLTIEKSKAGDEMPFQQSMAPTHAKSHDANHHRKRNLDNLCSDCLACKKSNRRHSYEVAVGQNSWLSKEASCFTQSKMIVNASSFMGEVKNIHTPNATFRNNAFDKVISFKRS